STVFNNVTPNTYTLTVKDAGGCSSSASVTVNTAPGTPPAPTASVVDPTCTVATGTITVTAPLGAQYIYSIDGINFQASTVFNNRSEERRVGKEKESTGASISGTKIVKATPKVQ